MTTEAEIGVMQLQDKACWQLPKAGRGKEPSLPWAPRGSMAPLPLWFHSVIMILDFCFWPPEL